MSFAEFEQTYAEALKAVPAGQFRLLKFTVNSILRDAKIHRVQWSKADRDAYLVFIIEMVTWVGVHFLADRDDEEFQLYTSKHVMMHLLNIDQLPSRFAEIMKAPDSGIRHLVENETVPAVREQACRWIDQLRARKNVSQSSIEQALKEIESNSDANAFLELAVRMYENN